MAVPQAGESPVAHTSPDLEKHLSAVNDFVATTGKAPPAAEAKPLSLSEARLRTEAQLEARLRWSDPSPE